MASAKPKPTRPRRMLSEHPVAEQFHPTLNGDLTADQVPYSGTEKVWWQCPDVPSHSWDAIPANRTKKIKPAGCRHCRGKRLGRQVPFERSLAGRFPQIAAELSAEESGFEASEILYGAKEDAWWRCPMDLGHPDYLMPVNSRTNPRQTQGCPYCAGKRLTPERSLASVAPTVSEEFVSAVNGTTPDEIFAQDNRRYVWQCSGFPQHRWAASPNNRVGKGSSCPYCGGKRVWEMNRLLDLLPALADQWDQARNGSLTTKDVSVGSSRRVYWRCPEGPDHRWPARVYKRASGQGCPFCVGHEVSETSSLLALRADLAAQLDAETSGISAAELTLGSNRLVWWICPVKPAEHRWEAMVLNRTFNGTGCPDCNIPGTSAQEIRLAAELSVVLPVDFDRHLVEASERKLRVDILVPAYDLVVEFDGSYWHESTEEADARKSAQLLTAVRHVVRVREHPLTVLDPVRDVVVPHRAPAEVAAGIVLDHLAALKVVPASVPREYRSEPGPRASGFADAQLERARMKAAERKAARDAGLRLLGASDDGEDPAPSTAETPGPF